MLEQIKKENDIKKLKKEELPQLAKEIRRFLLKKISQTGGHLASNLGVVELTIALHRTFSLPEDKIIWDVGHQSYTHKILTGRKEGFDRLRKYGGMSGFPKRKESPCDAFDTGHSSTAISAGLGYVYARDLQKESYKVISVLGDGSLTGGMAYEALNNASVLNKNFMIVLNDNHMSISENVGGMSKYLTKIRTGNFYNEFKKNLGKNLKKLPVLGDPVLHQLKKTKNSIKQFLVPGMFFEDMGITYLGPINGHDVDALCEAFQEASKVEGAVLLHVLTKKGKGYLPAEQCPDKFHGVSPFTLSDGKSKGSAGGKTYTDIFGDALIKLAKEDEKIVAITAAMLGGTGLDAFAKEFPQRCFDVGIAEAHGVTFAAGLAAGGMKPVFAVYSSFLQRGFDQIIHDVALQNLPVVFCIDRGGIVGNDGETHQGIFDISFLRSIPNLTLLSPKDGRELEDMLAFALRLNGPVAIRYPRGEAFVYEGERHPIVYQKGECLIKEKEIALISYGHIFELAKEVWVELKSRGYRASLYNARFAKPMDEALWKEVGKEHRLLVTFEENVEKGGFGEGVSLLFQGEKKEPKVIRIALPDDYIEHGNISILREEVGLSKEKILEKIEKAYKD